MVNTLSSVKRQDKLICQVKGHDWIGEVVLPMRRLGHSCVRCDKIKQCAQYDCKVCEKIWQEIGTK